MVVALVLVPIFAFIFGLVTMSIATSKGRSAGWFWMGFFFDIIGIIIISCLPDVRNQKPAVAANVDSETAKGINEPQIDKFDEIRKYKELLDDGIITQEEFETKKKELL